MILVSACLAGYRCRYDGGTCPNEGVMELVRQGKAIPACPEALGGLPMPRPPAELTEDGAAVLMGKGRVMSKDGRDVTEAFLKGAHETLRICRLYGVERAILKANSPSCGSGVIYDGSFTGAKKPGDGVTAMLLRVNGIPVESR